MQWVFTVSPKKEWNTQSVHSETTVEMWTKMEKPFSYIQIWESEGCDD